MTDERLITHVSNFRKVKRVDDVVRIFNGIQKQHAAKLVLVGEGPQMDAIKTLITSLGLDQKVHFLGKSKRIEQITCISDLFLLPSEKRVSD